MTQPYDPNQQPYGEPPNWGPPPGSPPPAAPTPPPPTPSARSHRKLWLVSIGAVLVLVGGGLGSYFAVADSGPSDGAGSPTGAVQLAVDDINSSDLVGLIDDLTPAERDALADPIDTAVTQFKRVDVLQPGTDPKHVDALKISIKNLTHGATTTIPGTDVRLVTLTGGQVDFTGDPARAPLSNALLKVVDPNFTKRKADTEHTDIAKYARAGDDPVQIAVQQVGGRWYPSLFYTIANAGALDDDRGLPKASDAIAARGAASPQDAVQSMLKAAISGNPTGVIAALSPTEGAVFHTYGTWLTGGDDTSSGKGRFVKASLTSSDLPGGAKLVTAKSVDFMDGDDALRIERSGDCLNVVGNSTQHYCPAAQGADNVRSLLESEGLKLTARQRSAIGHAITGLTRIGIVTTETDGKWYVAPVRSGLTAVDTVLMAMQPGDITALARLAN